MTGARDEGGIQLLRENIQNDWYYPEITDKASYMIYSLCQGHYFADCNKSCTFSCRTVFMRDTGIALDLATGYMEKDLLTDIKPCLVDGTEYTEEIKYVVRIVHSIDYPNTVAMCFEYRLQPLQKKAQYSLLSS